MSVDYAKSLPQSTTILYTGSVLPPRDGWRISQTVSSSDKNAGQPAAALLLD